MASIGSWFFGLLTGHVLVQRDPTDPRDGQGTSLTSPAIQLSLIMLGIPCAFLGRPQANMQTNIFKILNDIVAKQAPKLHDMPSRIEKANLHEFVQLDGRYGLVKATHRLAVFSQGILAMSKTFIGVIELDPRQLLEDGIRKELARQLENTLNSSLVFCTTRAEEFEKKLQDLLHSIHSQCRSMEYFQDYVHVHGHRLWQEEFSQVIAKNMEQECNAYLKRRTQGSKSTCVDIKNLSTVSTCM
ncbi:hypothetical protein KI387_001481, partial [Taxus chinensis]